MLKGLLQHQDFTNLSEGFVILVNPASINSSENYWNQVLTLHSLSILLGHTS